MIEFIKQAEIEIPPERQRQVFDGDALAELSDSITSIGLIHPIVVMQLYADEDAQTKNGYRLLTGERRFRAMDNLHMLDIPVTFAETIIPGGTVPCIVLSSLDNLTALELEYDENTKRKDLTWQEQAKAAARLAELRSARAAQEGRPKPTISEIATEIRGSGAGSHHTATKRQLAVAQHLHRSDIAKAKTVDEAFKILKREEVANVNAARAHEVGKTFSAELHRAYQADSKEWMKEQPAGVYDLILTDPPYGMGADEFGDSGANAVEHAYVDSWEAVQPTLYEILREGFRITKDQAHIYMFCDIDHFHELRTLAEACGWSPFRTPLIWHKISALRAPWPDQGPRRHYECILYAVKGHKPVTALYPDVISTQIVGKDSEYQAQKPVELFSNLIMRSCLAGSRILDPCMGSGTIFEAAHHQKCIADGVELLDEPYGIAVRRLGELK
jgi:site-specific DNA-methyltransferase (adenine-specific)